MGPPGLVFRDGRRSSLMMEDLAQWRAQVGEAGPHGEPGKPAQGTDPVHQDPAASVMCCIHLSRQ